MTSGADNLAPMDPASHAFQLYFDNDAFYNALRTCIEKSEHEILLEYYIFEHDSLGHSILETLTQAAARGVRVRLLVDGVGSLGSLNDLREECTKAGIEFRVFHPLPIFAGSYIFRRFGNLFRNLMAAFTTLNQRNHRKIALIDEKILFVGSQNITLFHSSKWRGDLAWRDTGLQVTYIGNPSQKSADFQFLKGVMEEAWRGALRYTRAFTISLRPTLPNSFLRLNSRLYWRGLLKRDLLRRITQATENIRITNPYFLPNRKFLNALKKAARRGVNVSLCLPEKSDVWAVQQASRSLYPGLLRAGVQIYEYEPRVLHAKTLTIDNWGLVGTHNFNHRSFIHDLEIEATITDPALLNQLHQHWEKDLQSSQLVVDLKAFHGKWWYAWAGRFFYWFRYWL